MSANKKKYIIVIGSGSYVIGDEYGDGVILRSLKQWADLNGNNEIALFYRSENKLVKLKLLVNSITTSGISLIHIKNLENFLSSKSIFASFICVPDGYHFFYAQKMLEREIPTWIVKPVTDNLEEAYLLLALSDKKNTPLWVDYHKRFDKSNQLLKKYIQDNNFGHMLHYSVQYTQPLKLPLETFSWAKETDVFSYIGCHYVDQLEFLFEKKIKRFKISSIGTRGVAFNTLGNYCYDSIIATMSLVLDNNREVVCSFQVGWSDPSGTPAKSHQRIEITFESGRLIMDQKERGMEIWDKDKLYQLNPYFFSKSFDPVLNKEQYSGYGYDSIKYFLDTVKNDKIRKSSSLPYIQNVLFSEKVLDASKKSLKNGGEWVSIDIKR